MKRRDPIIHDLKTKKYRQRIVPRKRKLIDDEDETNAIDCGSDDDGEAKK